MKKTLKKEISLEYYEDESNPSENKYKGGPVSPEKFKDLGIYSYQKEGEGFQLHIKGSKQGMEEFGKFLINIANYKTVDPAYHDHFDEGDELDGNTEVIIHHPDSEWEF